MNQIFKVAIFFLLLGVTGAGHAQTAKRYGFTATLKVPRTPKTELLAATQNWMYENLAGVNFTPREVNHKEGFIFGQGQFPGDFGTSTYDLTFYFRRNTVDVVADNIKHNRHHFTRAERKEITLSKGTPKRKTKNYLTGLSRNLETYLEKAASASVVARRP